MTDKDLVLGRFYDIIHEKLSFKRTFPSTPGNKDFSEEKKLLHSHLTKIYWGIGCTVISFISFRASKLTGPITWKSFQYQLKSSFGSQPITSIANNQAISSQSQLDKYISTLSDLVISALVGCSTTLFLIDQEQLKKDLVKIPLLQGKSHIADELCPDFITEYNQIPSLFWDQIDIKSGNFTDLLHIRDFVLNCQLRQSRASSDIGNDDRTIDS